MHAAKTAMCTLVPTRQLHTSKTHHAKARFLAFKTAQENLKSAPLPALVLGFSGLIPFVLPAAYSVVTMSCSAEIAYAQVAYGATILSFLGGVRWGFTLTETDVAKPDWVNLTHSVTPSLIAWVGLLMPLQASLGCVISGLLLAAAVDGRAKSGYPAWFRSLRLYLTTFAVVSLSLMYVYSYIFPDVEQKGLNWFKLVRIAQIILED